MIILPILTTSPVHFFLKGWENVLFKLESQRVNQLSLILMPIPLPLEFFLFSYPPREYYPGFQRFLALGELGPKSRAVGGWWQGGAEVRNPPPVISAPALRERETSGTQGMWVLVRSKQYIPPSVSQYHLVQGSWCWVRRKRFHHWSKSHLMITREHWDNPYLVRVQTTRYAVFIDAAAVGC